MINNLFAAMKGAVSAVRTVTDSDFGWGIRTGIQTPSRMVKESMKCKPLVPEVVPEKPQVIPRFSWHDNHKGSLREISSNGLRIEEVSVIVIVTPHCLTPRRVVDEFDFSWHETVA